MVKDLCFEIIEACPNECKFCSSNSCIDKKQIVSFDDFKRVIYHFESRGGIEELSLSGGEPFLHPDLLKMVEYAKSFGIRTVIFTSGIKRPLPLDDGTIKYYEEEMGNRLKQIKQHEPWNERLKNNVKKYYERIICPSVFSPITKQELYVLKNFGLDKIVFDYQAYEHETDEYIMGRNRQKYECLLDSLMNASIVGIETDVHFIPMKPNYKEIVDILEMLEIAKVNNISILKFVPQGRGLKNINDLMLSDNELVEFMKLLDSYRYLYRGYARQTNFDSSGLVYAGDGVTATGGMSGSPAFIYRNQSGYTAIGIVVHSCEGGFGYVKLSEWLYNELVSYRNKRCATYK